MYMYKVFITALNVHAENELKLETIHCLQQNFSTSLAYTCTGSRVDLYTMITACAMVRPLGDLYLGYMVFFFLLYHSANVYTQ